MRGQSVRQRSLYSYLLMLVIAQILALVALSAPKAQTVIVGPVPTTTTTVAAVMPVTLPDVSVFSSHVVLNPYPAYSKPSIASVQDRFAAPVVHSPSDLVAYPPAYDLIKTLAIARWGVAEWQALDTLLMHESRYDPRAVNPGSGACGIFQALPCSKLPGIDWRSQVDWGLDYISTNPNYGTPSAAWAHWVAMSIPCPGPDPYGFVYCGGWY
jgi:hypothetical protein